MNSIAALLLTYLTTAAVSPHTSSFNPGVDSLVRSLPWQITIRHALTLTIKQEICNGVNLSGQCEGYVFNPVYCYTLPAFYLACPGLSSFRGKAGTSCTFWE